MLNSIRFVFSNYSYVVLGAIVFLTFFMMLSFLSEFVFFEPYFIFSIQSERIVSFTLILIVSILSGLVIPMNIFLVSLAKKLKRMGSGLVGSVIGASAGACSCGPIGFSIISIFGTVGGTATAFLTMYEVPLRLSSIGILFFTFYHATRSIKKDCIIRK